MAGRGVGSGAIPVHRRPVGAAVGVRRRVVDGKHWFTIRLEPQSGFIPRLRFPCLVDPADPNQVFIDWNAAWEEHVPTLEQEAAVRHEVDRRRDGIEGLLGRTFKNPFTRSFAREEEALVAEAQAREA